jgi:TonB family protein
MARLRVRLELNRRSAGVPLDKLASVVEETRKFFHLLAEDVHIDAEHSEWVASDFDPEALNFTAEYSGAVTVEQVRAFGAAFAGATSLRRATIAQFTRIADFLGEDELVGFGLYQSDGEGEPSEWRCLSKRDAQRFGQEIQLLAQAAGESLPETSLPAVMNGSVAGRRLFKDRRERETLAADPAKLIREVESNLSRRIDLLEGEVAGQARKLKERRELTSGTTDAADERFKQLLSAMETFWTQAPKQMPLLLAAPEAPAATAPSAPEPVLAPPAPAVKEPDPTPAPVATAKKPKRWWILGTAMSAAAVTLSLAIPNLHGVWLRYTQVQTMPTFRPKAPVVPVLPVVKAEDFTPEPPKPAKAKAEKPKSDQPKPETPQRFEGPQIALEIPADVRAKVSAEARVEVIVAIDDQGNVTRAQVASTKGKGARLLTNEALGAARRSRFKPAREGERPVESQMVLTYLFKPDSAEF